MKFGLFILASWAEKDASAQSRIYGEALEQIQYAEELGFDSVWIAEHHSSRYGIFPSLMPILTHVAAKTKTIRIGGGVSVLPFYNPIYLAEESAMLDLLSDGRLDFHMNNGVAFNRRQAIPGAVYHRNGLCYGATRAAVVERAEIIGADCAAVIVDRPMVNIDDAFELELAEWLLERQQRLANTGSSVHRRAVNA